MKERLTAAEVRELGPDGYFALELARAMMKVLTRRFKKHGVFHHSQLGRALALASVVVITETRERGIQVADERIQS